MLKGLVQKAASHVGLDVYPNWDRNLNVAIFGMSSM